MTEHGSKWSSFVINLAINMLVYVEKPVVRMLKKVNKKDKILFPKFWVYFNMDSLSNSVRVSKDYQNSQNW